MADDQEVTDQSKGGQPSDSNPLGSLPTLRRRNFLTATGIGSGMAIGAGCTQGETDSTPESDRSPTTEPTSGSESPDTVTNTGAGLHAKTRLTWWTEDDRQHARDNIGRFDWAKEERDQVVSSADSYLDQYTLDDLWKMVAAQTIPREAGTRRLRDIMGGAEEPGTDRPWKLVTSSGHVMPTNDFAAYRESGRDDEGKFDPELADDQYLVNEEYPEKGDDWGVDDGYGWVDEEGELGEEGETLHFVAFYNHWYLWRGRITEMLNIFSKAYLYTDDVKYARAGTVLLDRIADVYPEMNIRDYPIPEYYNISGGKDTGKILGSLWEDIIAPGILKSYDAFFPGQNDSDLVEFLSEKSDTYSGLGLKQTPGHIRKNIEEGYVKQMLPATKKTQLTIGSGARDVLALSARILDEPDGYTGDALTFLYQPGGPTFTGEQWDEEPENWVTDGGNVIPGLVTNTDRDGYMPEGAPNYNRLIQSTYASLADVLRGYDAFEGADLWDHPKLYQLAHQNVELVSIDSHTPNYGDDYTKDQGNNLTPSVIRAAYQVYGDPIFAQVLHYLNDYSMNDLRGDIFDADPTSLPTEIENVIDADGVFDLDSTLLASHGFSALRDGENHAVGGSSGDDRNLKRAIWHYFGKNGHGPGTSHAHADTLQLGVMAHELNLAPDLGYPDDLGTPKDDNWVSQTISHNTVMVDGAAQDPQLVAQTDHFDTTERIKLFDANSSGVYETTEEYRRTTAMVHVDAENSYAVDFFDVEGGDDHLFSFHSEKTDPDAGGVSVSGLDLDTQSSGTYAGADVSFGSSSYNEEVGNGFNYLRDVRRAEGPNGPFSVDWAVDDHRNDREADGTVHLRLTMVNDDLDETALAVGEPPDLPENPDELTYLLARRQSSDLQTTFTSVVEPYVEERVIDSIEPVDVTSEEGDVADAAAVKVELSNGRTDYVARGAGPDVSHDVGDVFTFTGFFAVYSEREGDPEHAYLNDGSRLAVSGGEVLIDETPGAFTGTVTDFTKEMRKENSITLELGENAAALDETRSTHVYVDNADSTLPGVSSEEGGDTYATSGAFPIESLESGSDGQVTVGVGYRSPIRRFTDPEQLEDGGYHYAIEEGDDVRIPVSRSWSR